MFTHSRRCHRNCSLSRASIQLGTLPQHLSNTFLSETFCSNRQECVALGEPSAATGMGRGAQCFCCSCLSEMIGTQLLY
ncbi:hypothetical protein XELAEV_18038665mg [Xenopus laevis]|uniref:Uncharacterized protein n=1 Tax=Xenopus laevis TaxID=8355 RepID=A0A974H7I4_XENLA|nr:hypothetical protein XELAEV_18038665mg [Xenopus laevis]